MKQRYATRVSTIDGWPVFKDRNGDLIIECDGFGNQRYLSDDEEKRLLRVSRQLKNQRRQSMTEHATQIGTINGRPVYRDSEGQTCIETSDYQFLRSLTEEEARLFRLSKQVKNQVTNEDSKAV